MEYCLQINSNSLNAISDSKGIIKAERRARERGPPCRPSRRTLHVIIMIQQLKNIQMKLAPSRLIGRRNIQIQISKTESYGILFKPSGVLECDGLLQSHPPPRRARAEGEGGRWRGGAAQQDDPLCFKTRHECSTIS